MARISSSLSIAFLPTTTDGVDELTSWKKARQEYVRSLGHHLLESCSNESEIVEVFDRWEQQILELVKVDKLNNYLTALMTISLLHYFSRSYDLIKEHVPFVTSMLQHKRSRTISCAAALVFKWFAKELPDNIEFLRDLVANSVSYWIEASVQTRFAALLILDVSGKFILPNVFAVTSNKFQILWNSAICDDIGLRIVAAKVIDTHLNGLPSTTMVENVHCLFDDCLKQLQSQQPSNHGPVLICLSIVKKFSDDVIFSELDIPKLVSLLLGVVTVKSELLIFSAFSLLYEISQKLSHLYTPDTVKTIFTNLITGCQRFVTSTRLFKMIDMFIEGFNPLLIPVQLIIDFLKVVVKSPKYRAQQPIGFAILQTIFKNFKDVNVPAAFFLDAEPSPQYIDALRLRMALFNDTKSTLLKYYNDGIGPKVSKSQAVLSLHILRAFDSHLFQNKNIVYQQIKIFTQSNEEEVRLLVAAVLPLFQSQSALDDLLFLALFDESKLVRASAVKQLQHPTLLARSEMLPHVLDDPSFKVRRNAIPLIAKVAPLNPMLFIVPISSFVQHVISSMASSSDPYVCAKISTLFPLVAEHFLPLCPAFVQQVAKICFSFLDYKENERSNKTSINTYSKDDGGKYSNSNNNNTNKNNVNETKINNVIHRDTSNDGHALILNQLPFDQNFPNLRRIFHIENQEWIDSRDANLFLSIQKLAPHLSPFLSELVQIFIKVFSSISSDCVLLSALDALTEIALKLPIASNLPTTNPELFPVMMRLLRTQPSPTVAVKILKVMGTFGVTSFPVRNNNNNINNISVVEKSKSNLLDPIAEFDFKSTSFYTEFTMTALLKFLTEPHSSIFEAITAIFVKEGDCASKFLGTIVEAFSRSLATSKGIQKDVLFNQLEIISFFSDYRIEPYVKIIMPNILANVNLASAMRLAFVLSYLLKSEFIPFVQPLFQAAMRMLQRLPEDVKYDDILLKFISASIVFQNQPFDQFITECERALQQENITDHERMLLIVESLITVVQLRDASFECAHITRICIQLMSKTSIRTQVSQLLFSLSVYCQLSPIVIEFLFPKDDSIPGFNATFHKQIHFLKEYLKNRSLTTENFLVKYTISVQLNIPDYIPPSKLSQLSVFSNFPPPQFSNTEKWLEDLCCAVVNESPSISIRACHKIAKHSPSFRSDIFPIAFLSCWRIARQEDKIIFSSLIHQIFENEDSTNPTFLSLAELLVRAGHPLIISNFTIASACQSPAMALRFLVRHFREHPTDMMAVELMLTINMRLGRTDSSTGILKTVKLPTAGTWWEKLGDWKSALNIYRQNISKNNSTNNNDSFINDTKLASQVLRCYARLEKWEEIRNMFKVFEHMSPDEKKENAVWFAWAFYRINDLQKVSYFVNKFADTEDLNLMLFKEIFLVASAQNKSAKAFIEKSMHILVRDCSVYSALNASQADENLTYANYMVELEEALEYKETRNREIVKRWRRRLQYHNGDSYSWMRLVEIRNLAVLPYENKKTYLKLMSVLVKERRFELVNTFWNGMLKSIHEPAVQISYHKLLWALEKKREAISSLHLLNLLYDSEVTLEKFKEEFDQIPYSLKEPFIANIEKSELIIGKTFEISTINSIDNSNSNNSPNPISTVNSTNLMNSAESVFSYGQILRQKIVLTPKIRSRFFRIEGAFRAQLYQKDESLESLVQTMDLFEKASALMPDDYRNWAELAYAAIRAIGDESFVVKAMNGFLRATQLLSTNNLEYLCQLFSLFFRYGGTVTIPDEIVNLNPEIVIQILPQIVCQINHNEPSVRGVVHELLSRFSDLHFQALVFSLHLLIGSEDREKSTIASELLAKLGMRHSELAEEASIFVDGMLRSAITWYELWMSSLDAAFLESRRDYASGTEMLRHLFSTAKKPKCQLDRQFVKLMESPLATCTNTLRHFQPTEASFNTLWTQLKRFYEIVKEKFKKLETIELSSVSEELAKKRNFLLSIPGTYTVSGKSPLIKRIDPTLPILTTQQHPRLLYMTDTNGHRWKFLLKGNEDLRLDQRIMQFFNLINSLLSTNKLTADLGVSISKYAIVPFHPNAGLISWVTGADTLHQLVMEHRKSNLVPLWYENEMIQQLVGDRFDMLSVLQKAEIWDTVAPHCPANELHEAFWERTPDAVSWIQNVDTFVLSTALMSIAGYVIGLGDRHPSNIMIQRQTGHVVHIDFGDSFEVALNRERMPEKVPFRLTRMLVNAFGVAGIEGVFRTACEKIMRVLRDNKSSIVAQLEIFVHEPIFVNKDNGIVGEGQSAILDRVIEKLSGKDPPIITTGLSNSSSSNKIDVGKNNNGDKEKVYEKREELKVEEQVDELIRVASDPYRYVLHYIGWCQFW